MRERRKSTPEYKVGLELLHQGFYSNLNEDESWYMKSVFREVDEEFTYLACPE